MAVSLRPQLMTRERILGFGVQGVGKSNNILTLARRCPTDTFWVVDNDYNSYMRLLETDFVDIAQRPPIVAEPPRYKDVQVQVVGNVVIFDLDVDAWEPYTPIIGQVVRTQKRDDWLVVDSMTPTWDAVQGWFSEKVFDKGIEDYFLEVRIAKEKAKKDKDPSTLGAFEGWIDWPVINKQYSAFYSVLLKCPGHIYMTAETSKIEKDEAKEVKGMFGSYGVKPKGQKRLGHIPMTVLLLSKDRAGSWYMTTVKDRGRRELVNEPVTDFAVDYMMKVAGWQMKAIET